MLYLTEINRFPAVHLFAAPNKNALHDAERFSVSKKIKLTQRDAMKGLRPFILNPQGWLCRPEEQLKYCFLYHFLAVRRSRTRK